MTLIEALACPEGCVFLTRNNALGHHVQLAECKFSIFIANPAIAILSSEIAVFIHGPVSRFIVVVAGGLDGNPCIDGELGVALLENTRAKSKLAVGIVLVAETTDPVVLPTDLAPTMAEVADAGTHVAVEVKGGGVVVCESSRSSD